MSTVSNKDLKDILALKTKEEKVEFERELLHFMCIHHMQEHMGSMTYSKLAKKLGVSTSFVSQLFSGDKIVSLELLAKAQRALKFKYVISAVSIKHQDIKDENVLQLGSYKFSYSMELNTIKEPGFNNTLQITGNG